MKKFLVLVVSVAMMLGLVASSQANAEPTTTAPPAVSAAQRAADLSKLGNGKRLSAHQLKALGLKQVSRKQVARIKQLQKNSKGGATKAAVGTNYWYTWHNARNSWADRYYSGPYYSYPWYPYYVIYDNWKTCTYSGTGCIDAHAYTYKYLVYYYPNGTWYYYDTTGYTTDAYGPGWGPYAS